MKIGSTVKVIKRDVARFGEIGKIIGKENTILTIHTSAGFFWKVSFDNDENGLYQSNDLREVK